MSDELAILMRWAFEHMQKPDGSAVWLRLSTRGLEQPAADARPGRGDRRRPLGGAAGAGRAASPSPIRGRWRRRRSAAFDELRDGGAGGRAARHHLARTGCMPAGWRRGARRAAGHGGAQPHRGPAGAAGARRGAGDGAGRPPGRACLAGRGARASAWCRSAWTASARAAISRTSTGNTGWTRTPSWTPARRRCWAGEGARRGALLPYHLIPTAPDFNSWAGEFPRA